MTKKLLLMLSAASMLFMLSACGDDSGNGDGDSAEAYKDEMKVALEAEPSTLDPHMTTGSPTKYTMRHVYETLVALDDDYQPVPMLAEDIDTSDDGKTYTFHLREGVKFHNGDEMDADDVVASMNRWLDEYDIAESVMGEDAEFTKEDDYTVLLELEDPALGALGAIATHKQFPAIMPEEVIEEADDADGVQEFIGTGPFKFEEWKQDQRVHLSKFEDYVPSDEPASGLAGKKEAFVDDLYFEIVTDPSTRLSGLQTGEYDIGSSMDTNNYDQLKSDDSQEVHVFPVGKTILIYNREEGVFTDDKMRRAVNAAIDTDEILSAAFASDDLYDANPSYMNKDQKDWYSEAGIDEYNQGDPEKAKKILDEAGYDGEEINLLTTRDDDYQYKGAVVIKEQLEEAGIPVEVETVDWATYSDGLRDPSRFDMVTFGISTVTSPSQLSTLGGDRPGYEADPKITEMLKETETADSVEDAKEIWDDIQEYAWEEYMPATYIGEFNDVVATTDKVEGFTALDGPIVWNTKVAE